MRMTTSEKVSEKQTKMAEEPKGALDVVLNNILNKINAEIGTNQYSNAEALSEIYKNICDGCHSYIPS